MVGERQGKQAEDWKGEVWMKKTAIITFAVFAVVLAALPLASWKVDGEKTSIDITEEPLVGNPAAASGITLRVASCFGEKLSWSGNSKKGVNLLWDTEYTIGSGEGAKSTFAFSSKGTGWSSQDIFFDIVCSLIPHYGTTFNGSFETADAAELPMWEIVHRVAERTQAGEERRETVRIADYYAYYPVSRFDVQANKRVVYQEEAFQGDVLAYLSDFFRIPTGEDTLMVRVIKDENGKISLAEMGFAATGDLQLGSVSAFGQEGCYYTFVPVYGGETGEENQDQTFRAYGDREYNSGIFYIPYEQGDNTLSVDRSQIKKVCELPKDEIPVMMVLDEDRGLLYLGSRGKNAFYLSIYAPNGEEGVLIEHIQVLSGRQGENGRSDFPLWRQMTVEDGGILITWQDNSFSFVAEDKGEFKLWYSGSFPVNGMEEHIFSQEVSGSHELRSFLENKSYTDFGNNFFDPGQNIQNGNDCFTNGNACLFDGERLVLASLVDWQHVNVLLSVYYEDGLAYCGLYRHSGNHKIYHTGSIDGAIPQGIWERGCVRLSKEGDGE